MSAIRRMPVLVVAVVLGFTGPRVFGPQDHAANAPFAYTPPEGFTPAKDQTLETVLGGSSGIQKVWVFEQPGALTTPNITVTHTEKSPRVEEADLADLARGMPAVFAQSGGNWTEVRHETRVRPDGSRVGLIDGENRHGEIKSRVMQLVFPEDKGTAIVTATFAADQAAQWEPKIDASIAASTGVATRVPPPSPWLYVGWGVGGGVLAYLLLALGARRRAATS